MAPLHLSKAGEQVQRGLGAPLLSPPMALAPATGGVKGPHGGGQRGTAS